MRAPRHPSKAGAGTSKGTAGPATGEDDAAGRSALRKKGGGVRAWLVLDAAGRAEVVEAGKHSIMRRTGLPARDLRILDPQLSYPSTVLGRERAVVINLEHIKAIITAQEVLLLNAREPSVAPFVDELQRRLLRFHHATTARSNQEGSARNGEANWAGPYDDYFPSANASPQHYSQRPVKSENLVRMNEKLQPDDEDDKPNIRNGDGARVLPFEFIALEACLEAACSCLDNEARTLEQEAHPALDKLTSKISTLNLERVRQIKSRLVAITGRVQKVRDELEHLLDDDDDMAEMYLTDKLMQQHLDGSSVSSLIDQGGLEDSVFKTDIYDERASAETSSETNDVSSADNATLEHFHNEEQIAASTVFTGHSRGTRTSSTRSTSKHLDVEELEMLLEAYFVQIDGTLNELSTLREYVDDTEDYINIMLDDKQNHLLQMGVMLTTATLLVSAFVVVVGLFGMNITIDLFDENKAGDREFLWTITGGAVGTLVLYIIAMTWCKHRRLLE